VALYHTCPPERIRSELKGLLSWIDRVGPTMMPVIPAVVLLQGLQSIRPFPVGNMAVARTLVTLYLHHHGLPNAELVPVGAAALESPELLLRLLLWTESSGSYTELIDYTLDSTLSAYAAGARRWLSSSSGSGPLEEVALRLLAKARRTPGWFSARDATGWVGGRSGQTVLRHLNQLVRVGLLESLGLTRAKRYRLVSRRSMIPELARRIERAESRGGAAPRRIARRPVVDNLGPVPGV
jgi:Fic family protein